MSHIQDTREIEIERFFEEIVELKGKIGNLYDKIRERKAELG
jgi:hypothetical protein